MKKTIHITLLILATIMLVFGVVWVALVLLLINGIYFLAKSNFKFISYIKSHKWLSGSITVFAVFILTIFIRLFIIEIYEIPSGSMEDSLLPGDKIMVNKLYYGPVLPQSPFEIPWVNLLFYLNKEARVKSEKVWWKPVRLGGFASISRGDVLVFHPPWNRDLFFIKRCVALPGDEIEIHESELFINQLPFSKEFCCNMKKGYTVFYNDFEKLEAFAKENGIALQFFHDHKLTQMLPVEFIERLDTLSFIDSVQLNIIEPDTVPRAYPKNEKLLWSADFWGPMKTPYCGMQIELNEANWQKYGRLIKKFEAKIREEDERFYLAEQELTAYTFTKDYYFMMGDNRHDSHDSRFYGFIPQERIVGKATRVLWSFRQREMKWKRILKQIK